MIDISRLQQLFTTSDIKKLEDILFYRDDDGSYNLFEQYRIKNKKGQYAVYKYGQMIDHKFSTLKYALCWCINSRRNKLSSIRDVEELDRKLGSLDVEIKIQRSLLNTVDGDLYQVKLGESMLHRSRVLRRLEDYVRECDRWQKNKFGRSLNLHDK